jgi:hypothetical protein
MNVSRRETTLPYDNKQNKPANVSKNTTRITAQRRRTGNKISTSSKISLKFPVFFVPQRDI